MKVRDRFIQGFRRKISQHLLEFAEGSSGLVKILFTFCCIIGNRPLNKKIGSPVLPLPVAINRTAIDGRNDCQRLPKGIPSHLGHGIPDMIRHMHNVLHQLQRFLKDFCIDPLQDIGPAFAVRPLKPGCEGIVDMPAAIGHGFRKSPFKLKMLCG